MKFMKEYILILFVVIIVKSMKKPMLVVDVRAMWTTFKPKLEK